MLGFRSLALETHTVSSVKTCCNASSASADTISGEFIKVKITAHVTILILSSLIAVGQTTPAKPKTTAPAKPAQTPSKPGTTTPAETNKPAAAAKPAAILADTDAVIVIPGVCAANTPTANCGTKVTKAEFEQLLGTVNPNLPPDQRRKLGFAYAQLLAVANEGQKLGVDKDPAFQEQLKIEGLKLLAQGAQKKVQESSKPSQQEIESYYAENTNKFEELGLRRIMIPKGQDKDAKPEQIKELADKIHDRAAAGEDLDKLQAEAYLAAKGPGAPPVTSLGWKRHGSMDPRHEPQIAALRAGQVSGLLEDGQAFYIYKVDSKRMIPLESAAKEIEGFLQGEHFQQKMKQLVDGVKPQFNDAYFGTEEPAAKEPTSPTLKK